MANCGKTIVLGSGTYACTKSDRHEELAQDPANRDLGYDWHYSERSETAWPIGNDEAYADDSFLRECDTACVDQP